MFTRPSPSDPAEYVAWSRAERLDCHAPGALTAAQVQSKLGPIPKPQVDALLASRKADLEYATTHGALKLFPEDQWESLLLGPGLDGPSGPHTFICFSQETVDAVHRSCNWQTLPSEDKPSESYFVYGEGQVLVPRMPTLQPLSVRNPFQSSSNLPLPPPPPFVPQSATTQNRMSAQLGPTDAFLGPRPSLPPSALQSTPAHQLPPSTRPFGHASHASASYSATTSGSQPPSLPSRPPQLPHRAASASISHSTPASQPPQLPPKHTSTGAQTSGGAAKIHHNALAAQQSAQPQPHSSSSHAHIHSTAGYGPSATQARSLQKPNRSTSSGPSSAPPPSSAGKWQSTESNASGDVENDPRTRKKALQSSSSQPELPRCPDEVAGYCRSWNIAHQEVCRHSHLYWSEMFDPTGYSAKMRFQTARLSPGSPEFDYIKIRFINSWVHQSSKKPLVSKIKQVSCPMLERLFNQRQEVLISSGIKPNVTELYHGTCEANFTTLFTQGFQPPADYAPHPQCPISGPYADKLSTSLCKRTCRLCTSMPKHAWSMCHMWGLGIYCAIDSSKSDIYVSNKKGKKTDRTKRKMLLCSVILGEAENVKLLKTPNQMHDRIAPAPGKHSIFASGFKNQTIPTHNGNTLGVMHDEYIVFHPHQIMPLYIIEYSR